MRNEITPKIIRNSITFNGANGVHESGDGKWGNSYHVAIIAWNQVIILGNFQERAEYSWATECWRADETFTFNAVLEAVNFKICNRYLNFYINIHRFAESQTHCLFISWRFKILHDSWTAIKKIQFAHLHELRFSVKWNFKLNLVGRKLHFPMMRKVFALNEHNSVWSHTGYGSALDLQAETKAI